MIPLDKIINKNNYTYTQVLKGKRYCIYEQRGVANMRCFELFKLKVLAPMELNGKKYGEREVFPKNEDFGLTAWTICDWEKALARFNELENEQKDINSNKCWVFHPLILTISKS